VIIPVTDRQLDYAGKLETALKEAYIRVRLDGRSERMNLKIREAQLKRVPCMLIVGDKEMEAGSVSLRLKSGQMHNNIAFDEFGTRLRAAVVDRNQEFTI
jgi:threonyl-tRNA synthetase